MVSGESTSRSGEEIMRVNIVLFHGRDEQFSQLQDCGTSLWLLQNPYIAHEAPKRRRKSARLG